MIAFSCLFLLVISTVSTISTVSILARKHFYCFAHCLYHTRMTSIITCDHNTHHPHLFRPTWSMNTNPIGSRVAMMLPPLWVLWVSTDGHGCPGSCFWVCCLTMNIFRSLLVPQYSLTARCFLFLLQEMESTLRKCTLLLTIMYNSKNYRNIHL